MIWWIEQIELLLCTESDRYPFKLPKFAILAGIFWHRLSTNQIVRCFKLKKLQSYMRYQIDFLLPLKLQKISCYFGLCSKILLANHFTEFLNFWLVWLVNLNTGVPLLHCTCCYCWYYYCYYYHYYYFCSLFNFGQ